jgi:ABC-type multidrug transport system fused ATPase/permease subunit
MLAAGAAGYLVFRGLSVGGYFYLMDRDYFLTWMVALFALFDPVRKLAKVSTKFQQAEAAAQRIFELQDTPQERVVAQAPPLPRHSQSLEFRNVCFRYPSSASDALKHVNLTVPAGATVAIVGPNGSGKTTLVSLVPRLLEPTAGAVLIDGREISQYSLRSLRRQIGLVTQDPILFQGTIWENIACGQRHPRDEAVRAAAQKAFVDEFVCDLPTSYQTLVGEYGARLSGGQRQRIAIARAILRDPAILIFDEALSQIDSDSEQKIHQALAEFRKGRTTLIVAHQPGSRAHSRPGRRADR